MNIIGHEIIQSYLLSLYASNRLPGGLLLSGPKAIGKYCLAKAFATYLLVNEQTRPFPISDEHPVARRIASGGHGDIIIIQKVYNQEGRLSRDISIDKIRKATQFLHTTSLEGGWRIVLIDSVDDLSHNAANALLKILEEPPARAILLLISHSPAKVLPTIRSRCQEVDFHPLSEAQMRSFIKPHSLHDQDIDELIILSEGRPGYALQLINSNGLYIYKEILQAIIQSNKSGVSAYFSIVEKYGVTPTKFSKIDTFEILGSLLLSCLARLVEYSLSTEKILIKHEEEAFKIALNMHHIDHWIKLWQKVVYDLNQTHRLSLDRKQVLAEFFDQFV